MKSKYFKLLNRLPANKTHWAIVILYSIMFGIYDSYYKMSNIYLQYGGLFSIHIFLNYYFLIYKEEK
jgi:hypothetical protein